MDDLYDILGLSGQEFDRYELKLLSPRFYMAAMIRQQPEIGRQVIARETARLLQQANLTVEQMKQLVAMMPYTDDSIITDKLMNHSGNERQAIEIIALSGNEKLLRDALREYSDYYVANLIAIASRYHYTDIVKSLTKNYRPRDIRHIAGNVNDEVSNLILDNIVPSIGDGNYKTYFSLVFDIIHQGRADMLYAFDPEDSTVLYYAATFALMAMGEWTDDAAQFIRNSLSEGKFNRDIVEAGFAAFAELVVQYEYEHDAFTHLPNDWMRWAQMSPIAAQMLALYAGQLGQLEVFQELMAMLPERKDFTYCALYHFTLTPDCWRYWFNLSLDYTYIYLSMSHNWNIATVQQFIALIPKAKTAITQEQVHHLKKLAPIPVEYDYDIDPIVPANMAMQLFDIMSKNDPKYMIDTIYRYRSRVVERLIIAPNEIRSIKICLDYGTSAEMGKDIPFRRKLLP